VGSWIFNLVSVAAFFSPPILLIFIWIRLSQDLKVRALPQWRLAVGWVGPCAVSLVFMACIIRLVTNPCNVDAGDWSCVIRWRAFTRIILLVTPFLLVVGLFARKGTRIATLCTALAIAFDCLMFDMMA
jgi:hypothetical protein